jgi:hypothetical protein
VNTVVEVWRGGRIDRVGDYDDGNDGVREARARLDQIEREALFATQTQESFDLLSHFSGVNEWFEFWAYMDYDWDDVPEKIESTARRMLAENGGELVIRESTRATLLKRLAGPD